MATEFPPPSELAELRELFADHLVHGNTVKVLAAVAGDDDAEGRSVLAYPDPDDVDTVPGRIMPKTMRELRDNQWVQVVEWTARLPIGTAVTHGDRLLDVGNGELFEITAVAEHGSHVGPLYLSLELTQVTGGVL